MSDRGAQEAVPMSLRGGRVVEVTLSLISRSGREAERGDSAKTASAAADAAAGISTDRSYCCGGHHFLIATATYRGRTDSAPSVAFHRAGRLEAACPVRNQCIVPRCERHSTAAEKRSLRAASNVLHQTSELRVSAACAGLTAITPSQPNRAPLTVPERTVRH